MWLYHATFRANLASIKKLGLGAKQPKNWVFSEDNVVCLCSDPDVAFSFCESADDVSDSKYESGIVVLAIDASRLNRNCLSIDKNINDKDEAVKYLIYRGVIRPECIYTISSNYNNSKIYGPITNIKRVYSYE